MALDSPDKDKSDIEKLLDEAGLRETSYTFNTHSVIRELAKHVYTRAIDCFREAVSNSTDSGATRIEIMLVGERITLDDNGNGISSKEEFLTVGTDSRKADIHAIGEKGLGRISLLRMGGNVLFVSNNGEVGIRILLKIDENPKEETRRFDAFLPHRGTRLIIENPDRSEMPSQKQLIDYLGKTFAPRLIGGVINDKHCEPITIMVNHTKVQPPEKFIAKNTHVLTLPGGKQVRGCLMPSEKSNGEIPLYVKGVMVKDRHFISMNKFTGWINCDVLTPRTDRNDVVETPSYFIFQDKMENYTKSNFAAIENTIDENNAGIVQLKNKIKDIMKKFLRDANKIIPPNRNKGNDSKGKTKSENELEETQRGGVAKSKGGESGPEVPGWECKHEEGGHGPGGGPGGGTTEIQSTVPSEGEKDIFIEAGNVKKQDNTTDRDIEGNLEIATSDKLPAESKPVQFNNDYRQPMVIINLNNLNIKMAMKEGNHLGSKYFRIIPFLAPVLLKISNKESNAWTNEEYLDNLFRTTAYLYQAGGWT